MYMMDILISAINGVIEPGKSGDPYVPGLHRGYTSIARKAVCDDGLGTARFKLLCISLWDR